MAMTVLSILLVAVAAALLGLLSFSVITTLRLRRRYPPIGEFAEVGGVRMHYLRVPAEGSIGDRERPVAVFLHGATSNLRDQRLAFEDHPLPFDALFVDRPGLGWSERGRGNDSPAGQAATIAGLLDTLGIEQAVMIGHSFGGAVAARFAIDWPEKVKGLVLLSPASHPWPGGKVSWYNHLAARPVIGRIFAWLFVLPFGLARIGPGVECVFAPNAVTDDYVERSGAAMALRPTSFRANAIDVSTLYDRVVETAPLYSSIEAPTVIVTGDQDAVVYEHVHAVGLRRAIAGSKLVVIDHCGHKPDHIAPEVTIAAIGEVAGLPAEEFGDVGALARRKGAELATGGAMPDQCLLAKPDGSRETLHALADGASRPKRKTAANEALSGSLRPAAG